MSQTPISRKKASTKTITNPRQTKVKTSFRRSPEHVKSVQRRRTVIKKQTWSNYIDWSGQLTPSHLRWMTLLASFMVVIGFLTSIYLWFTKPTNLVIETVNIQGAVQYIKPDELRSQMSPYTATNLFLLDAIGLETMLEQQPWIRSASLRKVWPTTLDIQLEEQKPIAFWGRDRLLNQYGEIFTGYLSEKEGIFPYLYSPNDEGRKLAERYVYLTQLFSNLSLEIAELTEDDMGGWTIQFRDGPQVMIGRKDHEKRLSRLKVGYVQVLKEKFSQIRRIDLRYTNGFAVEWKQIPTSFLESDISKRIGS